MFPDFQRLDWLHIASYSVVQSDRNSFGGNVVLDSVKMDNNIILDQTDNQNLNYSR